MITDNLLPKLDACPHFEWADDGNGPDTDRLDHLDTLTEAILAPSYSRAEYGFDEEDHLDVEWARQCTDTIHAGVDCAKMVSLQASRLPNSSLVHLLVPGDGALVQYRFAKRLTKQKSYAAALALAAMERLGHDSFIVRFIHAAARKIIAYEFTRFEAEEIVGRIVKEYIGRNDLPPNYNENCHRCGKFELCSATCNPAKHSLKYAKDEISFSQVLEREERINAFLIGARIVRKFEDIAKKRVRENKLELANFKVENGRFIYRQTKH